VWIALLAVCLAGIASHAKAQDVETQASEMMRNRVFDLGVIEVVENEDVRNKTVDRVTDDDMRLLDKNFLADALNTLPGVSLSQFGARNETLVNVRGFDIKHVPIFQDGIPIYVPYDGYPDLGRFTTFDLSEVVLSKGFTRCCTVPTPWAGPSTWYPGVPRM